MRAKLKQQKIDGKTNQETETKTKTKKLLSGYYWMTRCRRNIQLNITGCLFFFLNLHRRTLHAFSSFPNPFPVFVLFFFFFLFFWEAISFESHSRWKGQLLHDIVHISWLILYIYNIHISCFAFYLFIFLLFNFFLWFSFLFFPGTFKLICCLVLVAAPFASFHLMFEN